MKLALYTNSISPHQLPLMRKLVVSLGADNVLYAYESAESRGRRALGWKQEPEPWCCKASECRVVLETCDILLVGGLRPVDLMGKRAKIGLLTLYMSERWFKPPIGMFRLLHPKYFLMAWRIVWLIRNAQSFIYLPIGIHAARDMARLCGLFRGELRCLFRAPKLEFERKPGGKIWISEEVRKCRHEGLCKKYCLDKMRMWGYFVEKSKGNSLTPSLTHSPTHPLTPSPTFRVLWVGRLLKQKRVDTIIRAVGELSKRVNSNSCCSFSSGEKFHSPTPTSNSISPLVSLDIYGTGPEEKRLKKMAAKYSDAIKFYPPVPITEVRKLMREHDVYVLPSGGWEGWGAVVSEALEEGMKVIGTYEAGSSATMLLKERLFPAGDWRVLKSMLEKERQNELSPCMIGDWSAEKAVQFLTRRR